MTLVEPAGNQTKLPWAVRWVRGLHSKVGAMRMLPLGLTSLRVLPSSLLPWE